MNSNDSDSNPYTAPQVVNTAVPQPLEPQLGVFRPRLAPRDALDWFLGFGLGVPLSLILYGLPVCAILLLQAPAVLIPVSIVSIFGVAVFVLLCGVHKITLAPHEVSVHRVILPKIRFLWSEVVGIRELSRGQALLACVFAPHRYCVQSFTFRQHFRIETHQSYFVFPPQDVEQFEVTVKGLWVEANAGQR